MTIQQTLQPVPFSDDPTFSPLVPVWQRAIAAPRISLNSVLLAVAFAMLAVLAGFLPFSPPLFPGGWPGSSSGSLSGTPEYTVQLPVILASVIILGPLAGSLTPVLLIAWGLACIPIFANGGGWSYSLEPGFGYLLATFPVGAWLAGTFHHALRKRDTGSRSVRICGKALFGTLAVHLVGSLYLLALTLFGLLDRADLSNWILRLSLEKAPYDLLACILLFGLVRQIRLLFWWALY